MRLLPRPSALLGLAVAAGIGLVGVACKLDPVRDDLVGNLGPDDQFPESEFHRPGQPCLACHDKPGGASPELILGGTIFADPDGQVPVEGAFVRVIDSKGNRPRCFVTNCNGNFMVRPDEWDDMTYPLLVSVEKQGAPPRTMNSHIGREGSCAGCHKNYKGFDSPGFIRIFETVDDARAAGFREPPTCPREGEPLPTQCPEDL